MENILFRVGLVQFLVLLFGLLGIAEILYSGVVESILLFEVLLLCFIDIAGSGDLIDGHLADHRSEISGAFKRLLFFKIVHLFDGACVQGGVVVLLVKGLLNVGAGRRDEGR